MSPPSLHSKSFSFAEQIVFFLFFTLFFLPWFLFSRTFRRHFKRSLSGTCITFNTALKVKAEEGRGAIRLRLLWFSCLLFFLLFFQWVKCKLFLHSPFLHYHHLEVHGHGALLWVNYGGAVSSAVATDTKGSAGSCHASTNTTSDATRPRHAHSSRHTHSPWHGHSSCYPHCSSDPTSCNPWCSPSSSHCSSTCGTSSGSSSSTPIDLTRDLLCDTVLNDLLVAVVSLWMLLVAVAALLVSRRGVESLHWWWLGEVVVVGQLHGA